MNWELITLLTGLMLFAHWFNFITGTPLADPDKVDVRAILFGLPYAMAARRLKLEGIFTKMRAAMSQELLVTSDPKTRNGLKKDNRASIYLTGRDFFTWEKSILCPICLHWWLTVIVAMVLLAFDLMGARGDFFLGAFTYLVNHFIIRKIA